MAGGMTAWQGVVHRGRAVDEELARVCPLQQGQPSARTSAQRQPAGVRCRDGGVDPKAGLAARQQSDRGQLQAREQGGLGGVQGAVRRRSRDLCGGYPAWLAPCSSTTNADDCCRFRSEETRMILRTGLWSLDSRTERFAQWQCAAYVAVVGLIVEHAQVVKKQRKVRRLRRGSKGRNASVESTEGAAESKAEEEQSDSDSSHNAKQALFTGGSTKPERATATDPKPAGAKSHEYVEDRTVSKQQRQEASAFFGTTAPAAAAEPVSTKFVSLHRVFIARTNPHLHVALFPRRRSESWNRCRRRSGLRRPPLLNPQRPLPLDRPDPRRRRTLRARRH